MDIVLLFPGQGSQKPGMAKDLVERFPEARLVFQRVDDALGAPLSTLCFDGPAEELTETRNAQPALLAHGAALWTVIRDHVAPRVVGAAGHSLGEFTAHLAADTFDLPTAARLVRRRGELMYRTGVERPGAMAAILGKLDVSLQELCGQATREVALVVPANYNDDMQVVVSGEVAGVERLMELAKEAGAKRAVRLNVSGAFHSPLMEPAVAGLREALDAADARDPSFAVWSNVSEEPVTTAKDARGLLLRQLTSPVRWAGEVRRMAAAHSQALFVELGPGNVLTGLMKRIAPNAQTATCGTAAEVDALLAKVG